MFKKILLFAIILPILAFTSQLSFADCSLSKISDIAKKVTPSVIKITVFKNGSLSSEGSGFFVETPKGIMVMTAGHMIPTDPGNYTYRGLVITNIKTFETADFTMKLDKVSRKDDLALLNFTLSDNHFIPKPLEINSRIPPAFIGDVVLVIGAPEGLFPQYTTGFTSRFVALDNNVPYMQLSARAALGNSGGPAVDCNGKVIGLLLDIAVGKDTRQFAVSFIRPGYIINQFINSK
jgi:S1-C subfamily serine protease